MSEECFNRSIGHTNVSIKVRLYIIQGWCGNDRAKEVVPQNEQVDRNKVGQRTQALIILTGREKSTDHIRIRSG